MKLANKIEKICAKINCPELYVGYSNCFKTCDLFKKCKIKKDDPVQLTLF